MDGNLEQYRTQELYATMPTMGKRKTDNPPNRIVPELIARSPNATFGSLDNAHDPVACRELGSDITFALSNGVRSLNLARNTAVKMPRKRVVPGTRKAPQHIETTVTAPPQFNYQNAYEMFAEWYAAEKFSSDVDADAFWNSLPESSTRGGPKWSRQFWQQKFEKARRKCLGSGGRTCLLTDSDVCPSGHLREMLFYQNMDPEEQDAYQEYLDKTPVEDIDYSLFEPQPLSKMPMNCWTGKAVKKFLGRNLRSKSFNAEPPLFEMMGIARGRDNNGDYFLCRFDPRTEEEQQRFHDWCVQQNAQLLVIETEVWVRAIDLVTNPWYWKAAKTVYEQLDLNTLPSDFAYFTYKETMLLLDLP